MTYLYDFLADEYARIKLAFDLSRLKGKSFLITGANGLIGSNLINFLYDLNCKYNLNLQIIAHSFSDPVSWLPKEKIRYLSFDLTEKWNEQKFDFLIHTATYGQPKKFVQNKLQTVKLNTETLIKLLENARKNNAKVLFISSAEVYGQVPKEIMAVPETYFGHVDTLSQRAVYAESKRRAETICQIFASDGLWVKIARLAVTYGPGIKYSDSRFMNEFIKRSLNDGSLTMMDAGQAVRCFCFVSDAVEMMLNTLFASKEILYNLSGVDNKTILQVAELITNELSVPLNIPPKEEKIEGTPFQLVLSNARYCHEFKKTSFIPFETGLKKTVNWLKLLKEKEV